MVEFTRDVGEGDDVENFVVGDDEDEDAQFMRILLYDLC